jgi:hypothetical protein
MSRTIARLILAMLLLPATGVVFVLCIAVLAQSNGPPSVPGLLAMWFAVYAFVFTYWILLWRSSVRWTDGRIVQTVMASVGSLFVGAAFGAVCSALNRGIPIQPLILFGGGIVPIVWVLATVILWRETAAERMQRLTALGGAVRVECPLCGYDLSGLRDLRCPECGSAFTLDQLLASQPKREEHPAEL